MAIEAGSTPRRRTALIGFAESLAAPETAWSLADAGFDVTAFTRIGAKCGLRKAREVQLVEIPAPEHNAAASARAIAAASRELRSTIVMPLDDIALWLCNKAAKQMTSTLVGPKGENAEFAMDKSLQLAAAIDAGFDVPPTERLDPRRGLHTPLSFPVVLKPTLAVIERDGKLHRPAPRFCANRVELAAAIDELGRQPVVMQPLLEGYGTGLFGIADGTNVFAISSHRRLRMMNPHGSGSSACISESVDLDLVRPVTELLRKRRWKGLFMIELLKGSDGRHWFIELNGRPWGSMALARRLGLEYPAWAAMAALDLNFQVPNVRASERVLCRHLGRELVHFLIVMRGPKTRAVHHWPSRPLTLLAMLIPRRASWYNNREVRVLLYDSWRTLCDVRTANRR